MNRTLTIALSLAAGLGGGLVSRYVVPETVHAQAQPPVPKEIRAQSFVLVNGAGKAYGYIGFDPEGKPVIKLIGDLGQTVWSTNGEARLQAPSR